MATVGSVSSSITTKTGIGGLASGMDLDSLVLKMTAASRLKITQQEQSLQKLEWKQSAYRSVTKALTEFRDKYLNSLSATNFKSSSLYNTVKAAIGEKVTAFTATAQAGATAGKAYVNKIEQLATSETITNKAGVTKTLDAKLSDSLIDGGINTADLSKLKDTDFMITLDGVTRTITFDEDLMNKISAFASAGGDSDIANIDDIKEASQYLSAALQDRVSALFDNPGTLAANYRIKVGVNDTNDGIKFETAEDSKLTLGYATSPRVVTTAMIDRTIYNTEELYKARVAELEKEYHEETGLGALGFKDKASNKLNIYSSVKDLKDSLKGTLNAPNPTLSPDGTSSNNYIFYINDVKFSINEDESISSMMSKINASTAGVAISYSEITDKFTLTAKQQGTGENIVLGDTNGNLLSALGLVNTGGNSNATDKSYGKNAIAYIDGQRVERSSNEFTVNGVAYVLKELYRNTGTTDEWNPTYDAANNVTNANVGEAVTLAPDATNLMETVRNFVKDYNALVDLLYGLTNEEQFSDYEPLTEEQRAAMSDSQVKAWEEKAKSGLLRSDSTVNKILASMRESFLTTIDGFGLFSMGITYGTTTDSWKSHGKLTISDESALRAALESRPDQVRDFFTNASKGAATKLDKTIDDAVRTTGGQGHRGSLIEMAGLPSTMSEQENALYTQILNHNKRINTLKDLLEKEESRLWERFTAMEEALSKINEQSSILSQYLGTGTK